MARSNRSTLVTLVPLARAAKGYCRITDDEMKAIMTNAVSHVYKLLVLKFENPKEKRGH
jgi:hypothetical protein